MGKPFLLVCNLTKAIFKTTAPDLEHTHDNSKIRRSLVSYLHFHIRSILQVPSNSSGYFLEFDLQEKKEFYQ